MLRHSASQIFGERPAIALRREAHQQQQLIPRRIDTPQLQSHTHSLPVDTSIPTAIAQDSAELLATIPPTLPMTMASPFQAQSQSVLPLRPQSQIEALPPHTAPIVQASPTPWVTLDPAMRHPVFFTPKLLRPPTGVSAGQWVSPVACGYVYAEGVDGREARL